MVGRGALVCFALLAVACGSAPSPGSGPRIAQSTWVAPEASTEPAQSPAEAPRTITIGAAGDVLVHVSVIQAAEAHADGFDHVLGELRGVIGEDAIAFVNLETPLSVRVPPHNGHPPILGAPPSVAAALAAAGVDVASVANNHAYDQAAPGLAETLRALGDAGVQAVGVAATDDAAPGPIVVTRGGVRVAFVAFTERLNRGPGARAHAVHVARFDRARASAALAAARASTDVVVVSMHWSYDFAPRPFPSQRALARWFVERGADLVIGTGPHILQEVERIESPRGDAACAYSLGNLVSNQGLRYRVGQPVAPGANPAGVLPATRDGAWLRARFRLEGDRVRIDALEAVPLWTHNNFLERAGGVDEQLDIRVRPLRAEPADVRAERRPIIERTLGAAVRLVD
jgi:poly-gamma-glutamate synthesis protein (capsule biosynthesis protein)